MAEKQIRVKRLKAMPVDTKLQPPLPALDPLLSVLRLNFLQLERVLELATRKGISVTQARDELMREDIADSKNY